MKKLYQTNELLFTMTIAVVNLLLYLLGQDLSGLIGIKWIATAFVGVIEIVFVYLWIVKNGLKEKYGLCSVDEKLNKYLYFFPLVILISINLWWGIQINYCFYETVLFIIVQMVIGFMEEIIYRGFLYKALCKYDKGVAFLLSSSIFGGIHIIHFWWGEDIIVTMTQIFYAGFVGLLFCAVFCEGKSIWPCIITHGLINSTGAFVNYNATKYRYMLGAIMMILVSTGFVLYFLNKKDSHILD